MKQYETLDEFLADCMTADDAIKHAFEQVGLDEKENYHAFCCGQEVKYGSGLMGTDSARCEKCGAQIVMVLNPHVSPILLGENCTHLPSEELWDKVGERQWFVAQQSAAKRSPVAV